MYTEEDVSQRFVTHATGAYDGNFILVIYEPSAGEWKYDTHYSYVAFTPTSSDVLVAEIQQGGLLGTVASLQGTHDVPTPDKI